MKHVIAICLASFAMFFHGFSMGYELTADDYDILYDAETELADYAMEHPPLSFHDMSLIVKDIVNDQQDLSDRTYSILIALADSLELRTKATNKMIQKTVQYSTILGVDANLLSIDVAIIDDGKKNKPVLMWVHGGSWYLGDKAGKNIEHKRDFALRNGWIFVSVNYRLSPKPPFRRLDANRVKYPDHNNDLADAIAWVYKNIYAYGGNRHKIGLIGHSAGAHLVSLAGTRREFLIERGVPFESIRAVASIDIDVYDVRDYVDAGIPMIINAFGDDEQQNIQASPLRNLYAGNLYPDFFVAKRGSDERIERINEFVTALSDVDAAVTDKSYIRYSHIEIGDAIGFDTFLTPDLKRFFTESFSR